MNAQHIATDVGSADVTGEPSGSQGERTGLPSESALTQPLFSTDIEARLTRRPLLRHRGIWIIGAIVVILVVAGLGYRYWFAESITPLYRTAPVSRGPITAAIVASGTVNPVTTVQVGSQVSGQIKELKADFNSQVGKGDVIARIDPDLFETQLAQAEADLAVAEATVSAQAAALLRARADLEASRSNLAAAEAQTAKARAALADARRDYERKRALAESGSGTVASRDTARATLEQAEAQLETNQAQVRAQLSANASAEAQVKTAEANVETAKAQTLQKRAVLRQAQVNLDHTYIRAPVDGTVILRNVDVGQTVAASLQAPVLFTIAQDLRAMQVDTSVDEADIGGVREGQRVIFGVDAYPGREFEGTVVQIRKAPQVVQNVVTYDVVVAASNPELLLLPGLTANVRVITSHKESVLRLPNAALRFRPNQTGRSEHPLLSPDGQVFVIGPDKQLQAVAIKLGISDGNLTEIASGALSDGQEIVIGEAPHGAKAPAVSPTLTMGPRL